MGIAQFTPMLLSSIQFSTFFVFGFFCVISVFVSAWLPETKGVPLELIQTLFDNKAGFESSREEGKGKRCLMTGPGLKSSEDGKRDAHEGVHGRRQRCNDGTDLALAIACALPLITAQTFCRCL